MKNFVRHLAVIGMIALGTATAYAAKERDPVSLKGNQIAKTQQHKVVRKDIMGVVAARTDVEGLKNSLYENRMAKDKEGVAADKFELKKAKADLRREKAYLRADRKELMRQQRALEDNARDLKKAHKKELCQAKRAVRKDLRKDDDANLTKDAARVETLRSRVIADEAKIEKIQSDRKEYLAYIDEESSKPHDDEVAWLEQPRQYVYGNLVYWF